MLHSMKWPTRSAAPSPPAETEVGRTSTRPRPGIYQNPTLNRPTNDLPTVATRTVAGPGLSRRPRRTRCHRSGCRRRRPSCPRRPGPHRPYGPASGSRVVPAGGRARIPSCAPRRASRARPSPVRPRPVAAVLVETSPSPGHLARPRGGEQRENGPDGELCEDPRGHVVRGEERHRRPGRDGLEGHADARQKPGAQGEDPAALREPAQTRLLLGECGPVGLEVRFPPQLVQLRSIGTAVPDAAGERAQRGTGRFRSPGTAVRTPSSDTSTTPSPTSAHTATRAV